MKEFLQRILREEDESERTQLIEKKFKSVQEKIKTCERELENLKDFREALANFHVMLRRI